MKRFFYSTIAIAMISSAFVACQKEQPSAEPENPVVEAKPFSVTVNDPFSASDPQTKVTLADGEKMSWEQGDENLFRMVVGTKADNGEVLYAKSMTINQDGTATFTFEKAPAENATVSFFYGNKDYGDLAYCFEGEQKQDKLGEINSKSLFLKAVNVTDKTKLTMSLAGNIRRFYIYSQTGKYSSEKVQSITMTSTVSWETIAGKITYDYFGVTTGNVSEYDKSTVKVSVSNPSEIVAKTKDETKGKGIYLFALPLSREDLGVNYVIATDKAEYFLDSKKLNFKEGEVTNLNVNLESNSVSRQELGSTADKVSYKCYFPNAEKVGASSVTNFTLGWCTAEIDGKEVKNGAEFYSDEVVSFVYKDDKGNNVNWITCKHKVGDDGEPTNEVLYTCDANETGSSRTVIITATYKPKGNYIVIPPSSAVVTVKVTQPAQ